MTPGDELRAAAAKIRTAAAAVPASSWHADGVEVMSEFEFIAEIRHITREKAGLAAQHFALWHTVVAELVAAWLVTASKAMDNADARTETVRTHLVISGWSHEPDDEWTAALAVARAINGGA